MKTGHADAAKDAAKKHWTRRDIPWDQFDPSKVDPDIVRIVKAASLVEYNGDDYAQYLCGVFHDDPEFQAAARMASVASPSKAATEWGEKWNSRVLTSICDSVIRSAVNCASRSAFWARMRRNRRAIFGSSMAPSSNVSA